MRFTSRCRDRKNAATTTERSPKPIIMLPAKRDSSAPSASTLQRITL